jgi:hypothetical protein
VPPGEIVLRIVITDIKIGAFGAAKAALKALENITGILGI